MHHALGMKQQYVPEVCLWHTHTHTHTHRSEFYPSLSVLCACIHAQSYMRNHICAIIHAQSYMRNHIYAQSYMRNHICANASPLSHMVCRRIHTCMHICVYEHIYARIQERLLAERLDSVCTHVRERISKAQSMLQPESRHVRRTSSSGVHSRGEGEDALLRGRLEDERAARRSAEARAGEWERRIDVLKDLVQVCRVCVCVCVCVCAFIVSMLESARGGSTCSRTCTRYVCVWLCLCLCLCVNIYIYIYIYILSVYVYVYMYT